MKRRPMTLVPLLCAVLASCSGECTAQTAAERAAGSTARCVASGTEAMCTRGCALLWCTIDGPFTYTARCFEIGTLTAEVVR